MSNLPKDYDVIIVGTGLTESILAAALSRIGKIVLHIDNNEFYGGEFSSHTLSNLIELAEKYKTRHVQASNEKQEEPAPLSADGHITSVRCNKDKLLNVHDLDYRWTNHVSAELREKLLKLSRRFSIDLCPNVFYSRGSFIELLISSDVGKYSEFRLVSRILARNEKGHLEKVPTSRAEVFKSSKLGIIEKRVMMQFVQACTKDNNFADFAEDRSKLESMSFRELIQSRKLPSSIANYLINSVAMCPDKEHTALEGLEATKRFLMSVGRFGDSPFLFSLYGSGELPQCYCRLAAVFGAIYYLNLKSETIHLNADQVEAITARSPTEEFKFNCKYLAMTSLNAPSEYLETKATTVSKYIARCVLITNKSILQSDESEKNDVTLFYNPKTEKSPAIYCIEASSVSQCCPPDYYLVYLFCEKSNSLPNVKDNFSEFIEAYFSREPESVCQESQVKVEVKDEEGKQEASSPAAESLNESLEKENESKKIKMETEPSAEDDDSRPKVLFEYFYSNLDTYHQLENNAKEREQIPSNFYMIGGSKLKLDFDDHVSDAEKLFKIICPDGQFLPKPPDPEDIIFDSPPEEDEAKAASSDQTETSSEAKQEEPAKEAPPSESSAEGPDTSQEKS